MVKDLIKWLGILSIVLGIIVGILEGNSGSRYDSFGWAIAITWIFAGIVSGALFLAIREGLEQLELIAHNTGYTHRENTNSQNAYPTKGKTTEKPSLESLSRSHTFKSLD